eukprot:TRINITY_DN3241_c0_g1_i1.p1 TRINITY_DN3241_c0_g1~~TRINITY_DN3241_c0_g1_i1.p1  ORF type:complete len:680 (-),score=79.33 TRINITY_DN3241_c0_g1_i1:2-2041(-)
MLAQMQVALILDTSLSMNERTQSGLSYLDLAKLAAESASKVFQARFGSCFFLLATAQGLAKYTDHNQCCDTIRLLVANSLTVIDKNLHDVIQLFAATRQRNYGWSITNSTPSIVLIFSDNWRGLSGPHAVINSLPVCWDQRIFFVDVKNQSTNRDWECMRDVIIQVLPAATCKMVGQVATILNGIALGPLVSITLGEGTTIMSLGCVDKMVNGNWVIPGTGLSLPHLTLIKQGYDGFIPTYVPFDQFQLFPLGQTDPIHSKLQSGEVWVVFDSNVDCDTPIGFVKAMGSLLQLYLLPYNFVLLFPLLSHIFTGKKITPHWQQDFNTYIKTVPKGYLPLLKKAFAKFSVFEDLPNASQKYVNVPAPTDLPGWAPNEGPQSQERPLLLHQLEIARLRLCSSASLADEGLSPVGANCSSMQLELKYLYNLKSVTLHQLEQKLNASHNAHTLPVRAMGNYIPVLKRRLDPAFRELRSPWHEGPEDPLFVNFGSRFKAKKRKRKQKETTGPLEETMQLGVVDEADVQVSLGDSFVQRQAGTEESTSGRGTSPAFVDERLKRQNRNDATPSMIIEATAAKDTQEPEPMVVNQPEMRLPTTVHPVATDIEGYLGYIDFVRETTAARAAIRRELRNQQVDRIRLRAARQLVQGPPEYVARYLSQLREEIETGRFPRASVAAVQLVCV